MLDSANGVLVCKIHSAVGLKDNDLFGTLDPYITVHVGSEKNPELGRTKCIEDNRNPKFDETLFVLLNHTNDTLVFEVKDRNVGRSDTSCGICTFDLKTLKENDNLVDGLYSIHILNHYLLSHLFNRSLSVMKKGKICGEVKVDLHYFPVNLPDKNEDGTVIPPKESSML